MNKIQHMNKTPHKTLSHYPQYKGKMAYSPAPSPKMSQLKLQNIDFKQMIRRINSRIFTYK